MSHHAALESIPLHDGIPPNLAVLEDEIASLASSIDAACWRLCDALRRFDEQEGWAMYGCLSCVQWLSWRLGWGRVASTEHLRVAHALPKLPQLSGALRAGQVSFTKIRAVTRVATPNTDAIWCNIARCSTGAQLEKIVRLTRRNRQADEVAVAREQHEHRQVQAYYDDDGMFVLTARLPADQGAVIEQALRKAEGLPQQQDRDLSYEQRRADALTDVAEGFLRAGAGDSDGGLVHQVVVHVDAEVLRNSAADGRSELEGAVAVSAETSRRLSCDADVVTMKHDSVGRVLDVGRRTRVVSKALMRALRERDGGCRFPSCTHRYVDAHHVRHWADGGETTLNNTILLCRRHHRLVHEGGFSMAVAAGQATFLRPDGQPLPSAWQPPSLAQSLAPVDASTAYPQYDGEPVDYDYVLDAVDSLVEAPVQLSSAPHDSPPPGRLRAPALLASVTQRPPGRDGFCQGAPCKRTT